MDVSEHRRLCIVGDRFFLERHGALVDALAQTFGGTEVLSIAPAASRRERAVALLRPFRKTLARLAPAAAVASIARERAVKSAEAFRARSLKAQQAIAAHVPDAADVLQVFSLFSASGAGSPHRHAAFLDYTMALARRNWPAWAPFANEEEYQAWFALEREMYLGAAYLFPMSVVVRDSLVRDYGAEPARITVVGGSGHFASPQTAARTYGGRRVVFNGADFARKGGELVLAAFELVRERFPDSALTVVGECPCPRRPGITHLGNVRRAELDRLLAETDVLLAPSTCDPYPGFVIEGMNAGAVPVVSAADGLPEIVRDGECGFVDPDPSAESLARHILRVFSDAALQRRFSEASRRRVASDLLWSHVARRIAGVLRPDLPAFPERELVASRS